MSSNSTCIATANSPKEFVQSEAPAAARIHPPSQEAHRPVWSTSQETSGGSQYAICPMAKAHPCTDRLPLRAVSDRPVSSHNFYQRTKGGGTAAPGFATRSALLAEPGRDCLSGPSYAAPAKSRSEALSFNFSGLLRAVGS